MLVPVKLMSMNSDPGYVPSYGWQCAILIDAETAAACGGDEESLYSLNGEKVSEDMLTDVMHRNEYRGVCEYRYTTGTLDIPDGKVIVQQQFISVCTNDGDEKSAWVVNADALTEHYQERAKHYLALAKGAA